MGNRNLVSALTFALGIRAFAVNRGRKKICEFNELAEEHYENEYADCF
jgi:hypothetical protein